jgi:hypothetical protein
MTIQEQNLIEPTYISVPEDDYPQWAAGSYAIKYTCIVITDHAVYESLADNNTTDPTGNFNPDKWALVGKTNAHKWTDDKISTQTVAPDSIVVEFDTKLSTSLAFLNTECATIKVEILVDGVVVWNQTKSHWYRRVSGWYSYFMAKFYYQKIALFEHRPFFNSKYRITLTGDICKLGMVCMGDLTFIGHTIVSPKTPFVDYSKYVADGWGETYLKVGSVADRFSGEVAVPTPNNEIVLDLLKSVRGKTSLYITKTGSAIFGFAKEPTPSHDSGDFSIWQFNIEGVV